MKKKNIFIKKTVFSVFFLGHVLKKKKNVFFFICIEARLGTSHCTVLVTVLCKCTPTYTYLSIPPSPQRFCSALVQGSYPLARHLLWARMIDEIVRSQAPIKVFCPFKVFRRPSENALPHQSSRSPIDVHGTTLIWLLLNCQLNWLNFTFVL